MDEIGFRGIVLFNIEKDENLNGVYTNNHPITDSRIFTETARLIEPITFNGTIENRIYDCFYFDAVDGGVDCTLTFRISNGRYDATWQLSNGNIIFRGQGFQMNDSQIAISYWSNPE